MNELTPYIIIVWDDLPLSKAIAIKHNGEFCIGLDRSLKNNPLELAETILHELGHCLLNSFYNAQSDLCEVINEERKINLWTEQKFRSVKGIL